MERNLSIDEVRELTGPFRGLNPISVFQLTAEQQRSRNVLCVYPAERLLVDFVSLDPQTEAYRQTVLALCLNGNLRSYARIRQMYFELKNQPLKQGHLVNILRNM